MTILRQINNELRKQRHTGFSAPYNVPMINGGPVIIAENEVSFEVHDGWQELVVERAEGVTAEKMLDDLRKRADNLQRHLVQRHHIKQSEVRSAYEEKKKTKEDHKKAAK